MMLSDARSTGDGFARGSINCAALSFSPPLSWPLLPLVAVLVLFFASSSLKAVSPLAVILHVLGSAMLRDTEDEAGPVVRPGPRRLHDRESIRDHGGPRPGRHGDRLQGDGSPAGPHGGGEDPVDQAS